MKIMLAILITLGTSLDIFATVICLGALLGKINKRQMLCSGLLFGIVQLIACGFGYLLASGVLYLQTVPYDNVYQNFISGMILGCMAIHLFADAYKPNNLIERRVEQIDFHEVMKLSLMKSINGFFIGIAACFSSIGFVAITISILLTTVIFVVIGYYFGYQYGYQPRNKVSMIGGILLTGACVSSILC